MDDADSFFKAADADGNGELTQAELDEGLKAAMDNFQGTMGRFGAPGGGAAAEGAHAERQALVGGRGGGGGFPAVA